MLTLLLDIFSKRSAEEILAFDTNKLHEMGIVELLSPVRQQSLEEFLNKVYQYAEACKAQGV
jgi:cysteine desulfuration protein SufE